MVKIQQVKKLSSWRRKREREKKDGTYQWKDST